MTPSTSPLIKVGGKVCEVSSTWCKVSGLSQFAKLGDCVVTESDGEEMLGEIVHVDHGGVLVKPFQNDISVGLGAPAWHRGRLTVAPHENWKGRVVNSLGIPIDQPSQVIRGPEVDPKKVRPPAPMLRQRINTPVRTGVNAIDLFTPLCAGQRIGIFAGSGIGKSTLLAMLARAQGFDAIVIGMVGERGREVREFLEDAAPEARARTVAVVSSGDESPMMRKLAPLTATTVAEYFRDQGESVLLIIDSITRYAHAAREVALAAGEPPVARGYPPSVFSELPMLLERAGTGKEGSGTITGVYSVLVDGDDHNEPVADCIRGTLDGHVVLSRAIAEQGRYPAIDVLGSVSRLSNQVWSPEEANLILGLRGLISRFEDTRDLRLVGGYHPGTDPELDKAVHLTPKIYDYLKQGINDPLVHNPFEALADIITS